MIFIAVIVAPAMNVNMYENQITQKNIAKLKDRGFTIVGPGTGWLACGMTGLEWSDVKPLVEKQLGDLGIPVYLYTNYQKGIKANEPTK